MGCKERKADRQDHRFAQVSRALTPAHNMQTIFNVGGSSKSRRDCNKPEINKYKKEQKPDIRYHICRNDQQPVQKTYAQQCHTEQACSQQKIAVDR